MPEAPNSSDNPTPPDESADFIDAEWTDDSSYQTLDESLKGEAQASFRSTDEWDEATLEWDDELTEPPEPTPQPTTTQEALSWIQPTWRRLKRLWQRLIAGVRRRIPAAAQLSDEVLSAILIGVLVILLSLLNGVRQPSAASPPPVTAPSSVEAPEENPSADAPTDAIDADSAGAAVAPPAAAPAPQGEPLAAPAAGDRIADIQAQMTNNSILNAQRVIDSVQADFVNNRLTLSFNGDWYRLSKYDQTQLAQALMEQSQSLSFTDLQFLNAAGDLLARSPVIGDEMIILQREQPPEVPVPERPKYRIMIDR